MTRVVWTESALADLQAIQGFVSRDSARYADLLVERILGAVGRIASFPRSGRVVPEFLDDSLREVIQGNYRIVYRLR
ncbi:MAG: type II toxin-antitoxin system RelE/ParE family toxin, partial [Phycisphaerales bacterium]|nr:type II toxin-antitoxin system RelE/ParE family toxin [Phycisphaerales bacterium]